MEEKKQHILQRCLRVFYRARSEFYILASVICEKVLEEKQIGDTDIEHAETIMRYGSEMITALLDIIKQMHEAERGPEEMPLPFESLEAMNAGGLREWLICKIEAKARAEGKYESE